MQCVQRACVQCVPAFNACKCVAGRLAATRLPPRPPWLAARPSAGHIRAGPNLSLAGPNLSLAKPGRPPGAGRPRGRPDFGGGQPGFSDGPAGRPARFDGWPAGAAGRPAAHHLGPIPPLTGHRFLCTMNYELCLKTPADADESKFVVHSSLFTK